MNLLQPLLRRLGALLLLWVVGTSAQAADSDAVRHALMAQFDRPDARLKVDPVAISGDAAVASWAQGERGGRALLRRHDGQWHIALCAGDALRSAAVLQEAGVPAGDAKVIARALAAGESRLTAAERARFSTFDGMVRMDASGAHPPVHAPK